MCCYSMWLKPRGVRVHRMCEWEVGGVGGSPDKLLVSSLNRTQGAWQAWRRGAVWVSIVCYHRRTERGKKSVPCKWTGYVQLWQFTRTSDNYQQVLRKRRDYLCFINCHHEEISSVGPHSVYYCRCFSVMRARVSRFIKVDDSSSLRVVLRCIRINVTCGLRVDRIQFPRWRRKSLKF